MKKNNDQLPENGFQKNALKKKPKFLHFPKTENYALKAGFTVLFAALIASLLLAVGLAIFDIFFREVSFAGVVRDSNYAIYAADTGIECAEYWDNKCPSGVCGEASSAFATSSQYSAYPTSGLMCAGQDILSPNAQVQQILTGSGYPQGIIIESNSATTTFLVYLDKTQAVPYCAIVQVEKNKYTPGGPETTTIISRGYNTCNLNDPNRIERTLDTVY